MSEMLERCHFSGISFRAMIFSGLGILGRKAASEVGLGFMRI